MEQGMATLGFAPKKLVPGQGDKQNAKIAFIGEAPGNDEERLGIPFCGPTGRILRNQIIASLGIPERELYFDNMCQEWRPSSWDADFHDLHHFVLDLRRRIRELPNLRVIVPVGSKALQVLSLFEYYEDKNGKQKPLSIINWRGSIKKSRLTGHKMVPIIHPSFYIHNPNEFRYLHVSIHDVARAYDETKSPNLNLPVRDHRIIYDTDEALAKIDYYAKTERWAFDVETSIRCLGFSDNPSYSDTIIIESLLKPGLHSTAGIAEIKKRLRRAFTHDHKIITQNGLFDMEDLRDHYGIDPTSWHIHSDTMYKHGLLYPELPHSLAFLTSIYTRTPFYKDEGRRFKPGRDPEKRFFEYNGKDCCVTLEADNEMEAELQDYDQSDYFYNLLMPLVPILYSMHRRGVAVDKLRLREIVKSLKRSQTISRIRLVRSIGFDPNPRSPIENEQFLKAVNCPPSRLVRSKKTQKVKCDEEFLNRLKIDLGHPAIEHALNLRNYLYLESNFTRMRTDAQGRYHPLFKLGPKSGRLACSGEGRGPQLQNIPERGPVNIRTVFVPPPGKAFVHADLAQADARVLAYIAPEPGLIKIFESDDQDIHSQLCSILFKIPREKITKDCDQRFITKRYIHAVDYGMMPKKFVTIMRAEGYDITTAEATYWRDYYIERFGGIPWYWECIKQQLLHNRTLTDLMGRKYLFLGEFDEPMYREAYSRPPQGTVGGYISLAMLRLQQSFNNRWEENDPSKAFMWNQVHDSLEIECEEKDVEEVGLMVKESFNIPLTAHDRTFTIPADFAVAFSSKGGSWGRLEKRTF